MSKTWLLLFLIASAVVLILCFIYGLPGVTFPFLLVLGFFGAFASLAVNASIQAWSNSGLAKLDKPNFWFSRIYNAWLYVNDREKWGLYASLSSYLVGAFLGTIFGGIILFSWEVTFFVSEC